MLFRQLLWGIPSFCEANQLPMSTYLHSFWVLLGGLYLVPWRDMFRCGPLPAALNHKDSSICSRGSQPSNRALQPNRPVYKLPSKELTHPTWLGKREPNHRLQRAKLVEDMLHPRRLTWNMSDHGGLVQIKWVICRFQPFIFQGVVPRRVTLRTVPRFLPLHHIVSYHVTPPRGVLGQSVELTLVQPGGQRLV